MSNFGDFSSTHSIQPYTLAFVVLQSGVECYTDHTNALGIFYSNVSILGPVPYLVEGS